MGWLRIRGIEKPPVDLGALAEPRRLQILHMLMEGVQCNCELGDALDMAPNLISHHMRVLREAGLVDMERDPDDARWVYYSVNLEALAGLGRSLGVFRCVADQVTPADVRPRRREPTGVNPYTQRIIEEVGITPNGR